MPCLSVQSDAVDSEGEVMRVNEAPQTPVPKDSDRACIDQLVGTSAGGRL